MTKREIVAAIAEQIGMTQIRAHEIVQQAMGCITRALLTEGRVELRGFGVFELRQRAARKGRNPRTGEPVDVPAKTYVFFNPGKEMEAGLRELDAKQGATDEQV